jgi:hypothetical protein
MSTEQMEEEATGLKQRGALRIFHNSDPDHPITVEKAKEFLEAGACVEVPAAGAGSYRQFAELVGLEVEDLYDSTSSAGDWLIQLKDGRYLQQTNRYPRFGFAYQLVSAREVLS